MIDDTGARSAYDPPLSPQQASAAAFADSLSQLTNTDVSAVSPLDSSGNVAARVTQTPGFPPVTVHTNAFGYTLPLATT